MVAPGWPLNRFPNGIVAYTKNLIDGFAPDIHTEVFAQQILGEKHYENVTDLSKSLKKKNVLLKFVEALLHQSDATIFDNIKYKRFLEEGVERVVNKVNQSELPIDILEVEESFGFAGILVKTCNAPVITRLHGPWHLVGPFLQSETAKDYKQRIFFEGNAIATSHGVTSPSQYVLEKTRDFYNIDLKNARTIPNPVPAVAIENQWNLGELQTPSILFVGRFDMVKGADVLLKAFRLMALKNRDVLLQFVGPDVGISLNGISYNFVTFIDAFIPEQHIKSRMHFLGHCDNNRIALLRKTSLITVVCSRFESFSISLVEALATGCPCVATAVGGITEIIQDGFNGLLVATESPEELAEKVLFLIDNPEKMQFLAKNAIKDCTERFSPKIVAAQTIDYYQSVIAMHR